MNYQVFCGQYILHSINTDNYRVFNATLTEELNKVKDFSFQIYPDHPYFNKLQQLIPNIQIKKNNNVIFKGRIIEINQAMDNSKKIVCESALAFLFDSIIRPFSLQGTPKMLYEHFFNTHNTQVGTFTLTTDKSLISNKIYFKYNDTTKLYNQVLEPSESEISTYYEATGEKILYIGKMTGANLDNNEYVNRSSEDYLKTYDAINTRILETIGGYIIERYVDDKIFIDWVDDFTDGENKLISTQSIEFRKNLMDLFVDNDASETYSVVIPLGAELETEIEEQDEDGSIQLKKRLTIESVNNGKDYLVNETALATYGWIVAPTSETTWDDVTLAENLKAKAQEFLANQAVMLKSTIEANAIDLSVLYKNIEEFKLGKYIIVKSDFHNLSKTYLLRKKITSLHFPENMSITLGETKHTLTSIQLNDQQNTVNKIENSLANYVLNDDVSQIINEEIENSSYIQQIPSQVMIQVSENYSSKSDIEELLQTVNTKLTQTESDWTFEFNKIVQQITNIDGTVNSNYQELLKYIRFVDGKIVLGEVGNDITLELQNDRLSFYNNNYEVAYITDGRLYITDGVFTNSLQVGIFAFLPRENGNLSFKRIKG